MGTVPLLSAAHKSAKSVHPMSVNSPLLCRLAAHMRVRIVPKRRGITTNRNPTYNYPDVLFESRSHSTFSQLPMPDGVLCGPRINETVSSRKPLPVSSCTNDFSL